METNGDAGMVENATPEENQVEKEEGDSEALEIKEEPQAEEMKDYAEDTMNELLGIYGYDGVDKSMTENLQLHHFAPEDGTSPGPVGQTVEEGVAGVTVHKAADETSPNKQADPSSISVEEQIVCAWCHSSGSKRYTLNTATTSRAFCSEKCFAAFRGSYFRRSKSCFWCHHVRPTAEMFVIVHREKKLPFCSQKCLERYTSEISGKDRDTKIKKILQRRYVNDIRQRSDQSVNGKIGSSSAGTSGGSTQLSQERYPTETLYRTPSKGPKPFSMEEILREEPSNKPENMRVRSESLQQVGSRSESSHSVIKRLKIQTCGEKSVGTEHGGVFLPPPTVMIPYPIFVPVPCPIPVPIPVSSKSFKAAQSASGFKDTHQPSVSHQEVTDSIPNRQNLFPSAFYPVTRTSLPESVPGSNVGPSGYLPLASLPPEGVFHHGTLYPSFLQVPNHGGLNRVVRLRGLPRSASMDLPVHPSTSGTNPSSSFSRSNQKVSSVFPSTPSSHAAGSSTHIDQEPKELSRTVKEALRSHLTRRLSQSALNLTEVGRFPDGSDELRRSHSLSRLPVRGMESVPEVEPSTSSSSSNKRDRNDEDWYSVSSSDDGSVHSKRRKEQDFSD